MTLRIDFTHSDLNLFTEKFNIAKKQIKSLKAAYFTRETLQMNISRETKIQSSVQ